MSSNRVGLAEGMSAFQMDVGLSSIVEIPAIAGQVGLAIRRVAGGTMEIGGQSLTWGQGQVVSITEVSTGNIIPVTGPIYVAASGATLTISGFKLFSEGNPGNVG